jgi:hypothetical protein
MHLRGFGAHVQWVYSRLALATPAVSLRLLSLRRFGSQFDDPTLQIFAAKSLQSNDANCLKIMAETELEPGISSINKLARKMYARRGVATNPRRCEKAIPPTRFIPVLEHALFETPGSKLDVCRGWYPDNPASMRP